jgi:AraC family transcriptional activator of pobA
MSKVEKPDDFYTNIDRFPREISNPDLGSFMVFRLADSFKTDSVWVSCSGIGFYEIRLLRGRGLLCYGRKKIEITGTVLVFFNPYIPYTLKSFSGEQTGFACVFGRTFFTKKMMRKVHSFPMFRIVDNPAYVLNEELDKKACAIFIKMLEEVNSAYYYKYYLIRSYLIELIHIGLKARFSE